MKSIDIAATIFFSVLFTVCCTHAVAQNNALYNQTFTNGQGNVILLGKSTRERLQQAPFDSWFDKNYADYIVDTVAAQRLKPLLQHKRFVIFMGTWCGDSRREVPRIYKLLDYCGVPASQIELINLNNADTAYKQSPGHEEKGLNIFRVPDLLVYDGKHEIGRVIESPVASWEKDLLTIAGKESYQPHYAGTATLGKLYSTTPLEKLAKDTQAIAATLKPLVIARGELHSYGNLLMQSKDTAHAMLTYCINTQLYPGDPVAWTTLATACFKTGDKRGAANCCRVALGLQPDNKEAAALLQQLDGQ